MKKTLLIVLSFIMSFTSFAEVEMADTMRSEGKIYVVVGVIMLLFVGILIYLFSIDKKLRKLEDQLQNNK